VTWWVLLMCCLVQKLSAYNLQTSQGGCWGGCNGGGSTGSLPSTPELQHIGPAQILSPLVPAAVPPGGGDSPCR
jgi:hypothetical protein